MRRPAVGAGGTVGLAWHAGVLRAHHGGFDPRDLRAAGVTAVAGAADLAAGRAAVQRVHVAEPVLGYIVTGSDEEEISEETLIQRPE